MEEKDLKALLKNLKILKLPSKEEIIVIIERAKYLLKKEDNILNLNGSFNIVGDLHGQFFDFLMMIDLFPTGNKILFLGDFVDRGYNSIEIIIYILILKILDDKGVFLIRGNHENISQTTSYGFKQECILKYDMSIYWKFCETFEYFPIASIINKKYFCMHGGIAPKTSIEYLQSLDRVQEYNEISSILWCDPSDSIEFFSKSQRGAGYIFGKTALLDFLYKSKCEYLVRSHQLVHNGIDELFDGKCITIWSAPNYCYRCQNDAAFMVITKDKHHYITFKAAEVQYILK